MSPQLYQNATIRALWGDFFTLPKMVDAFRELLTNYPQQRTLSVSWRDLCDFDPDFAVRVLDEPRPALKIARAVLQDQGKSYDTPIRQVHLRISEIPPSLRQQVRDLRAQHVGNFVSLKGLVRKVTKVEPKLTMGAFRCVCGHIQRITQPPDHQQEPFQCLEEEGGCDKKGNATKFTLLHDQSAYVDFQKIEIQEAPDELPPGAQPQRLAIYAMDDICGKVQPGDSVIMNGIMMVKERRHGMVKTTTFEIYLYVNSIEVEDARLEDIEISESDLLEIRKLSQDPEVYTKMVNSIAPAIFGMDHIKEALLLQQLGGVRKRMEDVNIRGDIHILLLGDPGVAKSQLMRAMVDISPRGIYASGQGSTNAGLTATAVKDDFGEGRWTLEAGALVLADQGLAGIDEIDKMNPSDRSAMHEALEQQRVSIAKAGITASLQCRCSLLAAGNPKTGRFDPYHPIHEQLDLPAPLISRFDAIYAIRDIPEWKRDRFLAKNVLRVHQAGALQEHNLRREDFTIEDPRPKPPIPRELLKKFIAYARTACVPVLTRETMTYIEDYYVKVRNEGEDDEDKKVTITLRQMEAAVRLAEASAKVRLSDEVLLEDARRAIHVMKSYIEGLTPDGSFDADIIEAGASHGQQELMLTIKKIVEDLVQIKRMAQVPGEDILKAAANKLLDKEDVKRALTRMKERKILYGYDDQYGVV